MSSQSEGVPSEVQEGAPAEPPPQQVAPAKPALERRLASRGRVVLVGAGPGDPELITVKGLGWLRRAEVVVYDRLVAPALLEETPPAALRIYAGKARGRHCIPQSAISPLLIHHAGAGRLVVRLKGGDPFVFGRGGEEVLACRAAGIPVEVVPGISSAVAAPAAAGIPVTHRGLASSFAVVTGHEDPTKPETDVDWETLAGGAGTLVVLMGVGSLPTIASRLMAAGRSPSTPAAVVSRATSAEQAVVTGTLADIAERARHLPSPATIVIGEVVRLAEDAPVRVVSQTTGTREAGEGPDPRPPSTAAEPQRVRSVDGSPARGWEGYVARTQSHPMSAGARSSG